MTTPPSPDPACHTPAGSRAALASELTALLGRFSLMGRPDSGRCSPPSSSRPSAPLSAAVIGDAAAALAPAVASLGQVARLLGVWDGVVHRRVDVRELDASPTPPAPARPRVREAERGGWRTWQVELVQDGEGSAGEAAFLVRHWLARREGHDATPGTPPAVTAGPGGCGTGRPVTARLAGAAGASAVLTAGQSASAQRPPRSGPAWEGLITTDDVARWARASGDLNAVHLEPGAAAREGLLRSDAGAGTDSAVVVHGLALAGLALAAAGASGRSARSWSARFLAPVAVGQKGVRLRVGGDGVVWAMAQCDVKAVVLQCT